MACPQPHSDPRATRKNAPPVRRRAGRARPGRRNPARRHHPLLHEPDFAGRSPTAPAADDYSHRQRIYADQGRIGRPVGRGSRQRYPRNGPSLSGPRAAPGPRFLLQLLPLLHPFAGRGPGRHRPQRGPPDAGFRVSPQAYGSPRRADFRRRSALHERRQAGLDPHEPACDSAYRIRPHRHENARRAPPADHPGTVPHAAEAPSLMDEPALRPSGRMLRRNRTRPVPAWPMPASPWARRPCCSGASTTTCRR